MRPTSRIRVCRTVYGPGGRIGANFGQDNGTVREQIQLEAQSLSTDLMYKLNQLGDLICQNVLYVR